ncbi:hypothetical protein [Halobacillus litoralis]|uniref:hypothetical protein n=1 Tax=Halobacillus litoralis TaxID=45668 RepID=UPI001CFDFD6E|nr:hypothetical protein [Halobacillus litoralis]
MKKTLRHTVYALIFLFILSIGYLKFNPPFEHGSIGATEDKHTIIVSVGNKSFLGDIHITDVSINNNQRPSNIAVQVSNTEKGFILTDNHALVKDEYTIEDYQSIALGPDTSPHRHLTKSVAAAAKEEPTTIYGLSISEDTSIDSIKVTYRYMGLIFFKTIQV